MLQRLATGWAVLGSKASGARLSAPVQTVPKVQLTTCAMDTASFSGVNQVGCECIVTIRLPSLYACLGVSLGGVYGIKLLIASDL